LFVSMGTLPEIKTDWLIDWLPALAKGSSRDLWFWYKQAYGISILKVPESSDEYEKQGNKKQQQK